MTKLPRTKEVILDEMICNGNFHPKNNLEESLPYFLEVLLDIRDNLEVPYLDEEQVKVLEELEANRDKDHDF